MLVVIIGYLYVIGVLAVVYMANGKLALGTLLLLFGGILPVGLWLWFISRRRRARVAAFGEELARLARLTQAAVDESPDHADEAADTDQR